MHKVAVGALFVAVGVLVSMACDRPADTAAGNASLTGAHQSGQVEAAAQTVSLADAYQRGQVEVSIHSMGASSGDVVSVTIRRLVDRTLLVTVPRGTVLQSASRAVQDMIVLAVKGELLSNDQYRQKSMIELRDDRKLRFLLEAYCLDFDKDNPSKGDEFVVGDPNGVLPLVVDAIPEKERSVAAVQTAIWLTRGVPGSSIRERFQVNDFEMRVAERAVATVRAPDEAPLSRTGSGQAGESGKPESPATVAAPAMPSSSRTIDLAPLTAALDADMRLSVPGYVACRRFTVIGTEWQAGLLTPAELHERILDDVYGFCQKASEPALKRQSVRLMAAATAHFLTRGGDLQETVTALEDFGKTCLVAHEAAPFSFKGLEPMDEYKHLPELKDENGGWR